MNGFVRAYWAKILTVVGWTGSLILLWAIPGSPLRRAELSTQAIFMQIRNRLVPTLPPDEVVIVAIDNDSLNLEARLFPEDYEEAPILNQMTAWPWPRQVHAELTRLLTTAGAKAVVFDVVFSTQSAYGPADDALWNQVLQTSGATVVLGANYTLGGNQVSLNLPHPDIVDGTPVELGFVNTVTSDNDNRTFILSALFPIPQGIPQLPSLAEAALETAGIPVPTFDRTSWIHYYSQPFVQIPYYELLVPTLRQNNWQDGAIFRDKIVLIGATADTLQDFHQTPIGRLSGPQIQAHQMGTLLENRAIGVVTPLGQVVLLLVIGLGGGSLLGWPEQVRWILTGTGLGIVTLTGLGFGVLLGQVAVPVILTGNSLIVAIGGTEASKRAIRAQLDKLRLRTTLDRYVSKPVAEEIMNQPDNFQNLLRGRKRQIAVLFSDIRGFTTLSSELPPEALIPQLNDYLTHMVQVITQRQGCIDKFIGDAIMAEFGSPISQGSQQDALNAVEAALAMRTTLDSLRRHWQEEGLPLFFAGIGINFGDAVAGNIGSPERLEYTVLGDTVNVASRVESLTKEFATDIIITQSVYDLVHDFVDTIPLGNRRIRGRTGETGLFQVIGHRGKAEDRTIFDQVHRDYLARLNQIPGALDDESLVSLL
ncbi:MAG: hypothetical protein OHK0012_08340 [Synechococcales cyanobacterium]